MTVLELWMGLIQIHAMDCFQASALCSVKLHCKHCKATVLYYWTRIRIDVYVKVTGCWYRSGGLQMLQPQVKLWLPWTIWKTPWHETCCSLAALPGCSAATCPWAATCPSLAQVSLYIAAFQSKSAPNLICWPIKMIRGYLFMQQHFKQAENW